MVELCQADALDPVSLQAACRGCWAAYYLVHSMDPLSRDFAAVDRLAAQNMARAAAATGLERIIYLGGLTPERQVPSRHLASRAEVGKILAAGPVPVTTLQAAMILGSGSASFEMMRYLTDRLPVIMVPHWIDSKVQPISVRNVLTYLTACLEHEETIGRTFDACGPEVWTYRDLLQAYAEEAGLGRRRIITVRCLTPRICAFFIQLITPVHKAIALPLTEGLVNSVTCRDESIKKIIPQDLMDARRTFRRILFKHHRQIVETSWTDAGGVMPHEWVIRGDEAYAGGAVIRTGYKVTLSASPEDVWIPVAGIGGDQGWYYANYLWRLRGLLDKLVGGVGRTRGRKPARELSVGDALDFWRIVEIRAPKRLLLVGELKAPGEMSLDFEIEPKKDGETELRVTGRFKPLGLWGLAYWYALLPFHVWIFRGLLLAVAQRVGRPIVSGPTRIGG